MSILNLNGGEYHILNWIATLLENRLFRLREDVAVRSKEYILENFSIDYKNYDVVCGYRADDSYFSYANAFLNNTLSLEKLVKAMLYGKLGEQIVLRTGKAFEQLTFVKAETVDKEIFYPKKLAQAVLRNTNGIIEFPDVSFPEEYGREYWAGGILAYYQWISHRRFEDIVSDGLPLSQICDMYVLHEADPSKFVENANIIIERNKLQRQRNYKLFAKPEDLPNNS